MENKHDRVGAVFAPDLDPLLDPADANEQRLIDPATGSNRERPGI